MAGACGQATIGEAWASGLPIPLMFVEVGGISIAGYKRLDEAVGLKKLYQNRDIARHLTDTQRTGPRVSGQQDFPYNVGDDSE